MGLVCSTLAWAQDYSAQANTTKASEPQASVFRKQIEAAEHLCPSLNCANIGVQLQTVSAEHEKAMLKLMPRFTSIVKEIAEDEWPDSILEETYYTAQIDPSIARVDAVTETATGTLAGYRIIYRNKAWFTGNCNFDERHPESLNSCQPGQFLEIAFVSADLRSSFRDPVTMVEFDPDQN
jgi:hypothetical protein